MPAVRQVLSQLPIGFRVADEGLLPGGTLRERTLPMEEAFDQSLQMFLSEKGRRQHPLASQKLPGTAKRETVEITVAEVLGMEGEKVHVYMCVYACVCIAYPHKMDHNIGRLID